VEESEIPKDLKYSKDDEWIRTESANRQRIGVTDYAQQQLGDIVFVELPAVGDPVNVGDSFGVIESVKAVSDLLAPVNGVVVEINPILEERPEAVNDDCYGDGWMVVIDGDDNDSDLLNADEYLEHIKIREE